MSRMNDLNPTTVRFHDPLIVKDGNFYYALSTDMNPTGVPLFRSSDLKNWRFLTSAVKVLPQEVTAHTGSEYFWAPELVKVGDEYRLYTSCSRFGERQSVISLFTAGQIEGTYKFKANVVKTFQDGDLTKPNAIDPNVVLDRYGNRHLVYGSFFGGIYILPLNEEGLPLREGFGKCIAGGGHRAVEGAYVRYFPEQDRFVMFLSYGSLNYDYNIRVGYAKAIDGPYIDSRGRALTDLDPVRQMGDKIMGGFNFDLEPEDGLMAPGHNSLLIDGDRQYIVHHIRREFEVSPSYMQLRRFYFLGPQKLLVSPLAYEGFAEQIAGLPANFEGVSFVRFDPFNNGVVYGRKIPREKLRFKTKKDRVGLELYRRTYEGLCLKAGGQHALTLIDEEGECLWGMFY